MSTAIAGAPVPRHWRTTLDRRSGSELEQRGAGRVAGNLNNVALNVDVAGKATGLPTVAPVNIGALAAVSSVVQAAEQISRQVQCNQPSIIRLKLLG